MEKISCFLRVYFVAIFQLYETTCSQLSYHKTFPKQRLFTSLKKPLFQDPSVQELQLLDLLSGGSINSKCWPTLLHWHRSLLNKGGASPLHTKEDFKQHQLCLQVISPLYPSPLRLYYTVLNTKWWLSCVTFRMGKSKTNAQILKIAINLLTQMRNGQPDLSRATLFFEDNSSMKAKKVRERTYPSPGCHNANMEDSSQEPNSSYILVSNNLVKFANVWITSYQ